MTSRRRTSRKIRPNSRRRTSHRMRPNNRATVARKAAGEAKILAQAANEACEAAEAAFELMSRKVEYKVREDKDFEEAQEYTEKSFGAAYQATKSATTADLSAHSAAQAASEGETSEVAKHVAAANKALGNAAKNAHASVQLARRGLSAVIRIVGQHSGDFERLRDPDFADKAFDTILECDSRIFGVIQKSAIAAHAAGITRR